MDPLSITASALTVAHVLSKVIRVGNAAYKSEDEKKAFNDLVGNLSVQIEGLQAIEERALKNRDDPRYAGFHAILESSKQFQNGKDAEPDPTGTSPGVLQRLVYAMDKMETRLESKQGFRASVKRLRWLKEREEFEETIAEIKQWTEVVNTVLRYGDHMRIIDIDENASDTNARVKHLEDEAAKAAEDRRLAAGERERAAVREEKKAADKAMKLRELRRLEIVRWISPLKFRERHYAILNQAPASITKPELLQTEEFDLWIRGRPWILHCEGKPGAGKTLLCALVGTHLNAVFEREKRSIPVLYLYLNHKERDSQSLGNLFGSLLKQLVQFPGTSFQSDEAQSLYQGAESEARPGWKEFYKTFCAEVLFYERVVIIVDALDEASPLDVAPQLLDALHKFPKGHTSVFLTSQRTEDGPPPNLQVKCDRCGKRPLRAYYRCLTCHDGRFYLCEECMEKGLYCENDLHELSQPRDVLMSIEPTANEIRDYIRAEFQAEQELGKAEGDDNLLSTFGTTPLGRLCIEKPWLLEEISNSIVAKADGMFALAQLYMRSFKSLGLTEPEILEMLDDPPEGYAGLYEQHMERISEESLGRIGSNVGMNALVWVVCASRPLRFSELQDALAINFNKMGYFNPSARRDKATIVRATAGLLTIDENEHAAVRLSHGTAQQYFDSKRDHWFPNASAHITRVSLYYLSLKELSSPGEGDWEDKEFEMRGIDYPFLEYAYQYWGDHANEAISDSANQAEVMRFVSDDDRIAAMIQAMWYLKSETNVDWDVRKGANALHVCAWFGLTFAVSSLLDKGMEVNSRDPKYSQTPLMYACRRGKAATVALLLDRGARVNAVSNRGTSALFEAVFAGHVEALEVLLAQPNTDINAPHPRRSNQTALIVAASEGKADIVRLLLAEDGLDVDCKDANNNTALSVAITSNQTEIALQLLGCGGKSLELDSTNWTGSSALILAAGRGQKEIVNELLSKRANPSIRDQEGGGTALLRAIDGGHTSVVESMLEHHSIDVNVLDDAGRGLLHGAATAGHVDIVQLLLAKGLDPDIQDNKRRTALHDASRNGAFEVTSVLLDKRANVSLEDHAGRTAKTVAWQQGHLEVRRVLDGRGPYDLTEQDLLGEYPDADMLPVWALATLGYTDQVSKAIATRRPEIYYLNPDTDDTALHCAVLSDQTEIVKMLLEAGMSADSKNELHRTPLHLAALTGSEPILNLLLASFEGEDDATAVNAPDQWGTSPLLLAHSNAHIVCCLLLIEAGATIPASKASLKQSLFFSAIENGRLEAVQRLVHMGADIQVKSVLGLTGLQLAKESGKADVERFLRKSKSMKVEGLGLALDEMDEEDKVEEMLAGIETKESPIEAVEDREQIRRMSEPLESPTPSLEERFQALEVPSRRTGSRKMESAESQGGTDTPRRVRVAQLA